MRHDSEDIDRALQRFPGPPEQRKPHNRPKYDGSGIFTSFDLQKVSLAYATKFARAMPISAEGETATHRALGFDHRGRVDVAVNPDQPEGIWLMSFLQKNRIPYFAFRMAVPGKATGAHIHIGPQSTRLKVASSF